MDSNHRLQESKSCALPLGDSPIFNFITLLISFEIRGWVVGLEPTTSRTTIWRANQLHHTHHINEPGGIRTLDLRLRRPLLYPAELRTQCLPLKKCFRKRVMGIEPTYPAWKAGVLPLNYTRRYRGDRIRTCDLLVPNQAL